VLHLSVLLQQPLPQTVEAHDNDWYIHAIIRVLLFGTLPLLISELWRFEILLNG
jgi:hypothetical protein